MIHKSYLFLVCCSFTINAAIKNYDTLSKELLNAANIFAVNNILENITDPMLHKWQNSMSDVDDYIENQLQKERSFGQGISAANKTIITRDAEILQRVSTELAATIKRARMRHYNFAKEKYAQIVPKLQDTTEEINALSKYSADVLPGIRKNMTPGFTDILDVKNMKDILSKKALILEDIIRKLLKDWVELSNKITVTVKLEAQKSRAS